MSVYLLMLIKSRAQATLLLCCTQLCHETYNPNTGTLIWIFVYIIQLNWHFTIASVQDLTKPIINTFCWLRATSIRLQLQAEDLQIHYGQQFLSFSLCLSRADWSRHAWSIMNGVVSLLFSVNTDGLQTNAFNSVASANHRTVNLHTDQ